MWSIIKNTDTHAADVTEGIWEQHFSELVQYKKRFHDTRVPRNWPENPPLGGWVATQRVNARNFMENVPSWLIRMIFALRR